jgi:hypothetical protein
MKKTLLTLALVATTVAAFAQGKVSFGNDSLHLFVFGNTLPQDASQAGLGIQTNLASGVSLIAGLYAGTSSTSLTLQSATTLISGPGAYTGLDPGRMTSRQQLLTIAGGVPQWFQIVVYDFGDATPGDAQGGLYWGASPLFQVTPGTSLSYPSIMPGGPGASTLAASLPIVVNAVPEPSSFALAGLGMASLLIFRRRK